MTDERLMSDDAREVVRRLAHAPVVQSEYVHLLLANIDALTEENARLRKALTGRADVEE